MNNTETYVTTIGELNKHIGEIVVCFYYKDYNKEYDGNFTRPYDEENISYMWAFKMTHPIMGAPGINLRHADLSGTDFVCLIDRQMSRTRKTPYFMKHEQSCSAQAYVRLATKEELAKYRNVLRYIRIFGNDTHKNNKRT